MTEQSSRLPTTDPVVETQPAALAIAMAPIDALSADAVPADAPPSPVVSDSMAEHTAHAASLDTPEEPSAAKTPEEAIVAAKKRIPPQAVVAQLIAAWPQAFFADPRAVKPLAIGTLQQILANRPAELEGFNSHAIRTGIKFYTSRLSYHYGMVHNTHRITLAGEPADEVDDKAREFAKTQIVAIQQQRVARRAAQNAATDVAEGEPAPVGDEPKPRRRFRRAEPNREAVGSAEASGGVGVDAAPAAPRRAAPESSRTPPAPSRPRAPRRDQRLAPTAPSGNIAARTPGEASAPAAASRENLTLEEKLARLAQHFGKPS